MRRASECCEDRAKAFEPVSATSAPISTLPASVDTPPMVDRAAPLLVRLGHGTTGWAGIGWCRGVVETTGGEELLMGPGLGHGARDQHHNGVGVANRRQPMRDHRHRPTLDEPVDASSTSALTSHQRRRVVEHQHRRILQQCGNRQPLPLTPTGPPPSPTTVVPSGNASMNCVHRSPRRRHDLLHDASGRPYDVVRNDAETDTIVVAPRSTAKVPQRNPTGG